MKNLYILTALIFCGLSLSTQTIRRVNNTPGLSDPFVYTSVQTAIDDSAPGDTIYIEPLDAGTYGSVTINKKIVIIGTGFDLDKTPNTSFDKRSSKLDDINLNYGSASSSIIGIEIYRLIIKDANIRVERCLFGGAYLDKDGDNSKGNAAQFYYNRIKGYNNIYINGANGVFGAEVFNNIFTGPGDQIRGIPNSSIQYNTFNTTSIGNEKINSSDASVISNNIFDTRTQNNTYEVIKNCITCVISNNLSTSPNALPIGNGNVNNANPTEVFVEGNPWAINPFYDGNVRLAAGSPAEDMDNNGNQIGAFGGYGFKLGAIPAIPVITSFTNTGAGTSSTPLSVTISIRSNN